MKSFLLALALTFSLVPAFAEAEKTKVCVDVKDKAGQPVKDAKGNVKQTCKEMKVHKKLEGTDIPAKK
jgi:hypothetical protein